MCYSRRQITCKGATKGNTKMSILEPVQCGRSLHLGLSNPPNEINFLTGNHQSLTAKCRSRTPYFKCTRTHTHTSIFPITTCLVNYHLNHCGGSDRRCNCKIWHLMCMQRIWTLNCDLVMAKGFWSNSISHGFLKMASVCMRCTRSGYRVAGRERAFTAQKHLFKLH